MGKNTKVNKNRPRKRKWNGVIPSQQKRKETSDSTVQIQDISSVSCSSSRKLDSSFCSNEKENDYFMLVHFQLFEKLLCHAIC